MKRIVFLALRGEGGQVEYFWPVQLDYDPGERRITSWGLVNGRCPVDLAAEPASLLDLAATREGCPGAVRE